MCPIKLRTKPIFQIFFYISKINRNYSVLELIYGMTLVQVQRYTAMTVWLITAADRNGPHRTTSFHIGPHRITSDQIWLNWILPHRPRTCAIK